MIARFYVPEVARLQPEAELNVTDEVFHHAVHVRRLEAGAHCVLFCGDGCDYEAEVLRVERKHARLRILACRDAHWREVPYPLILAMAVVKNERMDWAVQKAVELGATDFVPFYAAHHAAGKGRDEQHLQQRWQAIVQSASAQCGRSILMNIRPVCDFQEVLALQAQGRWICHPYEDDDGKKASPLSVVAADCAVLIGPEAGFCAEEVQQARAAGWQRLTLGPRILRTETAALAALLMAQTAQCLQEMQDV